MKIGFIGLGNLGTPIAENILQKQKELFVYNRTASKAKSLADKGAIVCESVKELAAVCNVVLSIVSDDTALREITEGNDGLAKNSTKDAVHVSMSTILPATATRLAEIHKKYNNHYVSAPVMGRPEAARLRKLNFLVSGEKSQIEMVKPLLVDAGGTGIWEFGNEIATANVAKLCTNFLIASAIESMAEGINLAAKSGVDATTWLNMLTDTIFTSSVYMNYGKMLLDEAFQPAGFSLRLGLKDANLILQQANEVSAEMPVAKLMQQRLKESVDKGLGEHDWTAVALALK
jgi:3-hydroxyisobutyrate dehydrogenase-like beta-hydroxyacid dehydrogenase